MWFQRKNKPLPAYTPPSTVPTSHRRTVAATAAHYPAPAMDRVAYEWLLNDADRLDAQADSNDTKAEKLLDDAIEWRTVAANYRRLALQYTQAPAVPVAPQEPAYDEPQHPADPDPSRFNPTWQLPPQPGMCGCVWGNGESCELCDPLSGAPISILSPWTAPESDAGSTVTFPAVDGWTR